MRTLVFLAALGVATTAAAAPQAPPARQRTPSASQQPDRAGEAYAQFLLAQRLEAEDNVEGAVAAYKRAVALDPQAADLLASLASLYMRANRSEEATTAANQALAIDASNADAHRVLGTIYAELALTAGLSQRVGPGQRGDLDAAIQHFEKALARPAGEPDVNIRAMLARLYIAADSYDKAIPILTDLVREEPQWQEGATLLTQAFTAAGRSDDAIRWLESAVDERPQLYGTLADLYTRQRRWNDAAATYENALRAQPRSVDLRVRYSQALLSVGGIDKATRARDILRETAAAGTTDERVAYLLSQAERISGDPAAAEATARKMLVANKRSPRGYEALAEALEERQRYQEAADLLAPAIADFRTGANSSAVLSLLLPHLGFAYQELGQVDKAIATFEEARKLSPDDDRVASYLIQALLAGKKYAEAADLAHGARASRPDDLRLARLEARALREGGKVDQGAALLSGLVQQHEDQPGGYVALAQYYTDANRGADAIKVLQGAQSKFPTDTTFTFQLGAVLDKQKRYAESETVFRQLVAREPQNAAALNYLGYMMAVRGDRLDESIEFVQRALKLDPDNSSFLDSLGWAYFKSGKTDLALQHLGRAAEQLATNSVVQDHYGDALFKVGRYDEAVAAWTRALSGDLDSVDRGDLDKKIKSARQKLSKK